LTLKFLARPPKRAWTWSTRRWVLAFATSITYFTLVLITPLIPYESAPQQPEEDFPEEVGNPTDEQLAQCQTIFDDTEARRAHIEQKAQWAFTVIAFLVPSLASVFAFLLRGSSVSSDSRVITLVLLGISAFLLFLSFVAAVRALAIRRREFLYFDSVINSDTGYFRKYDKALHAQGLLYCANVNTATNDHVAQFVKSAYLAMFSAVIIFSLAAVTTGFQMSSQRTIPPTKTELVGTVSFSPNDISALHDDVGEVSAAITAQANSLSNQKQQMEFILDRMTTLESEVGALQKQISRGDAYHQHPKRPTPGPSNRNTLTSP
jgi:hypothetical protein